MQKTPGDFGQLRFVLVFVCLLLLTACSSSGGDADGQDASAGLGDTHESSEINPFLPTATEFGAEAILAGPPFEVTGNISALLDGESFAWETGKVEIAGELAFTSEWSLFPFALGGGLYDVSILGFATDRDSNVSFAAFQPSFQIAFSLSDTQAGREIVFPLPSEDSTGFESADILLLTYEEDELISYIMTDGELKLTIIAATPEESASFEGGFSGTLTYLGSIMQPALDPNRTIVVTEGQFTATEVVFTVLELED